MNIRLKEIRKTLGLNQTEFAASLDMGQTSYSAVETGGTRLTDKNITLICLKHGVNEEWLRAGIGEMFTKPPRGPNTPNEEKLIDMFRLLVPEMQAIVLKKVKELLDSIEKPWIPPLLNNEKGEEKSA